MRRGLLWLAVLLLIAPADAQTGPASDLAFDPRPGTAIPDARVRGEDGREVALSALTEGRPTILALEYLRCPSLCGLVLGGLAEGLAAGGAPAYSVIALSIDPAETPADGADARRDYGGRYGEAALRDWRFVTAREPEINRVADAVGFRYRRDPATGQYAHPAGLVVATPDARVSRYLFGVAFAPADLRDALAGAAAGDVAAPPSRLLLLCADFDPASGRYTPSIIKLLRWAGGLTVAAGALWIGLQLRRDRRAAMRP